MISYVASCPVPPCRQIGRQSRPHSLEGEALYKTSQRELFFGAIPSLSEAHPFEPAAASAAGNLDRSDWVESYIRIGGKARDWEGGEERLADFRMRLTGQLVSTMEE